jgi:hypothetical protein
LELDCTAFAVRCHAAKHSLEDSVVAESESASIIRSTCLPQQAQADLLQIAVLSVLAHSPDDQPEPTLKLREQVLVSTPQGQNAQEPASYLEHLDCHVVQLHGRDNSMCALVPANSACAIQALVCKAVQGPNTLHDNTNVRSVDAKCTYHSLNGSMLHDSNLGCVAGCHVAKYPTSHHLKLRVTLVSVHRKRESTYAITAPHGILASLVQRQVEKSCTSRLRTLARLHDAEHRLHAAKPGDHLPVGRTCGHIAESTARCVVRTKLVDHTHMRIVTL